MVSGLFIARPGCRVRADDWCSATRRLGCASLHHRSPVRVTATWPDGASGQASSNSRPSQLTFVELLERSRKE